MDDQTVHIEGYATTHGDHPVHGGPAAGGWVERIDRQALERAVQERPTVPLRIGADGPVIGEARLSVDDVGLRIEADLEPRGYMQRGIDEGVPYGDRVHNAVPDLIRAGRTALGMSFQTSDQRFSDNHNLRQIFGLKIGEVSINAEPQEER